jgi:hypothetical protein
MINHTDHPFHVLDHTAWSVFPFPFFLIRLLFLWSYFNSLIFLPTNLFLVINENTIKSAVISKQFYYSRTVYFKTCQDEEQTLPAILRMNHVLPPVPLTACSNWPPINESIGPVLMSLDLSSYAFIYLTSNKPIFQLSCLSIRKPLLILFTFCYILVVWKTSRKMSRCWRHIRNLCRFAPRKLREIRLDYITV